MKWISLLALCSVAVVAAEETLVFSEEFDVLDESIWEHLVTGWRGGNHEFQYYRNDRKNSYVEDGILYIKPTLTADEYGEDFIYNGELNLWDEGCNFDLEGGCIIRSGGDYIVNPVQSARLRSNIGFSFAYGRVEVRAQVPKGDWLWPAIWFLPQEEVYGGWPRSGEMDIMESKGNTDLTCQGELEGHQKVGATMHWGPDANQNGYEKTNWMKRDPDHPYGDEFHTYGMNWTPEGMAFSVDGEEIGSISPPEGGFWELGEYEGENIWESGTKMAPFDEEFHFVLNVAVGGNFFPENCINGNGAKPWHGKFVPGSMKSFWQAKNVWYPTWNDQDSSMKIDYIRVYQEA